MQTSLLKRGALALGGAALLLSATIGFSQAQTATPTTDHQQQHAAVLDLAAAKLGLTSDQLTTAIKQARKDLGVNQGGVKPAQLMHQELQVAANALGIADVKTLRKELAGTTLTAVAQNHGVQPSTVASALKADVDAKIQALVTTGKIKAEAKVDAFMTRQFKAPKAAT